MKKSEKKKNIYIFNRIPIIYDLCRVVSSCKPVYCMKYKAVIQGNACLYQRLEDSETQAFSSVLYAHHQLMVASGVFGRFLYKSKNDL